MRSFYLLFSPFHELMEEAGVEEESMLALNLKKKVNSLVDMR